MKTTQLFQRLELALDQDLLWMTHQQVCYQIQEHRHMEPRKKLLVPCMLTHSYMEPRKKLLAPCMLTHKQWGIIIQKGATITKQLIHLPNHYF